MPTTFPRLLTSTLVRNQNISNYKEIGPNRVTKIAKLRPNKLTNKTEKV